MRRRKNIVQLSRTTYTEIFEHDKGLVSAPAVAAPEEPCPRQVAGRSATRPVAVAAMAATVGGLCAIGNRLQACHSPLTLIHFSFLNLGLSASVPMWSRFSTLSAILSARLQ
jgi:hypothetical protein